MAASNSPVGAVIVAAGASSRMGGVDKLFASLAGKPLLAHTLAAFEESDCIDGIVLVLLEGNLNIGRQLTQDMGFRKVTAICPGGPRRQDSVCLGLVALGPCDYVLVHDGARPLVSPELIEAGLNAARRFGAAVPVIPLVDTIKERKGDDLIGATVDRSLYWAAQTPQVFRYDLLQEAHAKIATDVTDDAAMVEALGHPVRIYAGSSSNIKVTCPDDLALAAALLEVRMRGTTKTAPLEKTAKP